MEQNITIERKAAKGGLWLAGFKFSTQLCSWAITVVVARILSPGDYGLMQMATILTGYVAVFSELGLGASIIQREEIRDQELSSLFHLGIIWGGILALICFFMAYPTVALFNDRRILRLTQAVSFLYLIEAFSVVPIHILHRELRFKAIGFAESLSVVTASVSMLLIARAGGGVWTLVLGNIIQTSARAIVVFFLVSWRPRMHFCFEEVKSFLKFGLNLVGASSLHYVESKSDSFFGGRSLGANALGYYSMALQLSTIPLDKFVSLINSISFPVFSRYQRQYDDFNNFFLRLIKIIGSTTIPIYFGGFLLADQLIPLVLGEKWLDIVYLFKILCIAQILVAITVPTMTANAAQGRPHWGVYAGLFGLIIYPLSFYIASKHGLNAMVIPWITTIPMERMVFTWITLRKLGIPVAQYCKSLIHPILATACMIAALFLAKSTLFGMSDSILSGQKMQVLITVIVCACTYLFYCFVFQRSFVFSVLSLMKPSK